MKTIILLLISLSCFGQKSGILYDTIFYETVRNKFDTVKVIILYTDTSIQNQNTQWGYAYEVLRFDYDQKRYIRHVAFLNRKKKPFKSNFIIFQSERVLQ